MLAKIDLFFSSWRFAVFALTLLLSMAGLVLAMLVVPETPDALGRFVTDFKVWCFGYDPATGGLEWGYVFIFVFQPLVLSGVILLIWRGPLGEVRRNVRMASSTVGAASGVMLSLIVMLVATFLPASASTKSAGEAPKFPARELRTSFLAPAVSLVDHTGTAIDLKQPSDRLTVVTAFYSRCGFTCPMLLRDARAALETLTPTDRQRVSIVAITLDPENDSPAHLKEIAASRSLQAPEWRLASGAPADVEKALDAFSFQRRRNENTGVIDHSNFFVVIDKEGRIAYRLSLGDATRAWLPEALQLLLAEPPRS